MVKIYKYLRSQLSEVVSTQYSVAGNIKVTEDILVFLKTGIENGIVSSDIIFDEKTIELEIVRSGQTVRVELLPKISFDFTEDYISENGEYYFNQFGKSFTVPNNFYIHELFSHEKFDETKFKQRLEYAIKVYKILDIVKDYKNSMPHCEELFLYATKPLVVQTIYKHADHFYLEEAEEIIELLESNFKNETYKSFLKIQIVSLLNNTTEKDRFNFLLENFRTVYLNFKNSVDLFFREYDYQKNKSEIEKNKIDLAKKIHGVVNEIGAKIITIPLGYLLILKELKLHDPFYFLNGIFIFVSIVYAVIIETSISNQFLFLKTLSKDIEEFLSNSIAGPELEKMFSRYRIELGRAFQLQSSLLIIIRVVLWLLPMGILGILFLNVV